MLRIRKIIHEAEHGNDRIDNSEELEPQTGSSGSCHRSNEEDCTRSNVHNAVHLVHHENAEKHIISSDSGNEPEDSNRQEDDTKKHSECFSHSDLLLV